MRTDDFLNATLRNPIHQVLLDELTARALPDAWIVAGSLTQTVWNVQTGRPVDHGINDYDVFYFDADVSWEAEDRVIASLRPIADRLGVRIEARNQARVHLWYPQKHGLPYPALQKPSDGIDRFLTRCTQVGIRRSSACVVDVYAPAGLEDIATMIVRPNHTANFSADAYRRKAARWLALWPKLTVVSPGDSMRGAHGATAPPPK